MPTGSFISFRKVRLRIASNKMGSSAYTIPINLLYYRRVSEPFIQKNKGFYKTISIKPWYNINIPTNTMRTLKYLSFYSPITQTLDSTHLYSKMIRKTLSQFLTRYGKISSTAHPITHQLQYNLKAHSNKKPIKWP